MSALVNSVDGCCADWGELVVGAAGLVNDSGCRSSRSLDGLLCVGLSKASKAGWTGAPGGRGKRESSLRWVKSLPASSRLDDDKGLKTPNLLPSFETLMVRRTSAVRRNLTEPILRIVEELL